jgi:signal transduction histidine kinase
LAEASDAAEKERALRDIQGGVKRMTELFAGIRILFKTREGAEDFARGDLASFIANLVHEPGVWPAGAPITLELPPQMWCSFSPTLMRHALVNLIGNAVAYSAHTWVRVRLARICGARWQISFANGGPGIPIDHVPYLFDLGLRLEGQAKSGMPGLGLYLARMCVRSQGATLRLRVRPQLTVFSFALTSAQRSEVPLGRSDERVPAA